METLYGTVSTNTTAKYLSLTKRAPTVPETTKPYCSKGRYTFLFGYLRCRR